MSNRPKKNNSVKLDPVKKAYTVETFTQEQIQEIAKCSNDFLYFATKYVYVIHPTRGKVLFEPYDYQFDMLRSFTDYRQLIFMCGRQLGKTTCAAIYILWRAIFQEDQTVLIASNKSDSAIEVIDRIKFAYESLPHWLKPGVITYNRKNIIFENQSRIITRATTKDTGRGLSISLLYVDEFAAVDPPRKQKDFWSAIRPTLSTGGDCIITSTPLSDEDTFAQIWFAANDTFDEYGNEHPRGLGKNGFKAIKYTWAVHPDKDQAWADQEIATIGIDRFKREHDCDFISDSDTLINPIKLATMAGIDPKFHTGQTRWYSKPEPNKTYLVSLDPSLGTGGDFGAIQVYQLPEMLQVAEWQHNRTDVRGQVKTLLDILRYLDVSLKEHHNQYGDPEIYWTVENNAIGEAANIVIKETGEDIFPGTYLSEVRKAGSTSRPRKGFHTTNKNKLEACSRMKSLIERDKMIIKSKPLVSQLKVFVTKGASFGGKSSEHDDLVSACLLIVRMLERVMKYNDEYEEILSESIEQEVEMPLPISVLSTLRN